MVYELLLLVLIGCGFALAAFIGRVRRANAQESGTLLLVGGLVTAGIVCCLAAMVLFILGLASATDDVGTTWSNTGAHKLIPWIAICAVGGIASFIAAWVVRRRG